MTIEIEKLLVRLEGKFNAALNQIHHITLTKFRTLTRSVGQRTRVDRSVKPSTPMDRLFGCCKD